MSEPASALASQLLQRLASGEPGAERRLFELVYDELKGRAQEIMRHQPAGHTLQPTALVHEAWLKLGAFERDQPNSRTHFVRLASRAMRQVLVDHARARATDKRGGAAQKLALEAIDAVANDTGITFLALDEALTKLAAADRSLAQVAELRLFGGLEHAEIATTLGVSTRTVERAWKLAREWLQQELPEH